MPDSVVSLHRLAVLSALPLALHLLILLIISRPSLNNSSTISLSISLLLYLTELDLVLWATTMIRTFVLMLSAD